MREEGLRLTSSEGLGFWQLVLSDHRMTREGESTMRTVALLLPRLLLNPSLQLAFLVRVAQRGPRAVQYPVRLLQIVLYSSEIYWFRREQALDIGPGISFPHPMGIILGPGTRIGKGVSIYNNTNIGADRSFVPGNQLERTPQLGDGSVVYAYAVVQGGWEVGHDAVVGLRVMLDCDVPAGALKTINRLRLRGEWPGHADGRDTASRANAAVQRTANGR